MDRLESAREIRARIAEVWDRYLRRHKEVIDGHCELLESISNDDYAGLAPDDIIERMIRAEDYCAELLGELEEMFAEPDDGRE